MSAAPPLQKLKDPKSLSKHALTEKVPSQRKTTDDGNVKSSYTKDLPLMNKQTDYQSDTECKETETGKEGFLVLHQSGCDREGTTEGAGRSPCLEKTRKEGEQ